MKYISRGAAAAVIQGIFADPDADTLTLDEVYAAVGRDLHQPERNKRWIGNRLIHLRHHGLVTTLYTSGHPRKLDKIQLTPVGKEALVSDIEGAHHERPQEITLEDIAQAIIVFEKQNPSICLDLRLTIR